MIQLADIRAAHRRISPYVHNTPVLTNGHIDEMINGNVYFKCENFQKGGAFKARGAFNAVLSLDDAVARKGVVTHSSGNHAAAVALAARIRGIPATVVMPSTSLPNKLAAVRGYGARVLECPAGLRSRETAAQKVLQETGGVFVHPYDDFRVIAGAATASVELLETTKGLDIVTCPLGGGGLLAGTALSTNLLEPAARVIAAEPAGADDGARSFRAGKIIPQDKPDTIADGLLTSVGKRNFAVIERHVSDVVTVDEDAIVDAMKTVWQYMKIIIEPSAAVPVAAILGKKISVDGARVGLILSGGNADLHAPPWLRVNRPTAPNPGLLHGQ